MPRLLEKISLGIILLVAFGFFIKGSSLALTAQDCEEKLARSNLSLDEAKECEGILNKLYQDAGEKKRSLQAEVSKFNAAIAVTATQIYSTTKQIKELEKEIGSLGAKIGDLDVSLNQLSEILAKRIVETYKKGKIEPLTIFFASRDFSDFVARFKYLKVAQLHDRQLIFQMETVRTNFEDQKTLKEQKQKELETAKKKLEGQKTLLGQQKAAKENLLRLTQNDELRYQQLLAASRAEIEAIQGIIAGKGQESEVGKVGQGSTIATIITGASACSTGTHLHFEVREKSEAKNPLSFLRNINLIDDSGGDSHEATGSWDWPLNEPIKFNQGFGAGTAAIRSRTVWYNFHTGIDLVSDDRTVKAVKSGTLYRGSIACGRGTLRYVRLDHDDSEIDTYYLHVNY